MDSVPSVIGICVLVFGGAAISIFHFRNQNILSATEKKEVNKIRWDWGRFSSKTDWILVFTVPVICFVIVNDFLGYERLSWMIFSIFMGIILWKESIAKNKAIAGLSISKSYVKTDKVIVSLLGTLFIVVGIISLFT